MRSLAILSSVVLWAACDARATTQAAPGRADLKSRELESCAASVDCQDGLRCFEQVCRRTDRSTLGDYQAALASRAEAAGDLEAALSAYAEAISRYGGESLRTPVEIDCAYGRALARGKANRERAELAARVLHRCLLATPPGSGLRMAALAQLAELDALGLDPQHLAAEKAADVFLSKAPAAPVADKLAVAVSAEPTPGGKSWPIVAARLAGADLRAPLVKCWEAHYAATRAAQLAVSLQVKTRRYTPDPDYPDETKFTVAAEDASGLSGPAAAADACVRATVEPVLKKAEGVVDSFQTKLTLTIQ